MKKCKCIKDYRVKVIEYISPLNHTIPYFYTIFEKGSELVFIKKPDGMYFVGKSEKELKHLDYYITDIEYFEKNIFDEYFEKIEKI